MRNLSVRLAWPLVLLAMLVMAGVPAYGQGNTTTLSGVVTDDQGGVVPGADVTAKNNATAFTVQGVTDGTGRFTLNGVTPGTYTVTVALMGFKTAVLPDIQVQTGTPASIKVTLKVGTLEETVVVTGQTEVVQATSPTVASTIAVKQIQQLPVISHTALDFVVSLPGIETSGTNFRASTVNGLSTYAINITLDGINVQDKRSSEGMYMYIRPMMDSIEEVSVSTSNSDAASTGSGGANIRMETRSGSNRFTGSVYDTWRNQAGTNNNDVLARKEHPSWLWGLNTPYWFNKRDTPKTAAGDYYINDVRVTTPGFRVGGPIVKDKLFYFFNYEEFRLPQSIGRTRYVLTADAQAGNFTYPALDGTTRTVNLFTVAANNGQTSTADPAVAKLLADIRTATTGDATGAFTSLVNNVQAWNYSPSSTQKRQFPTVRVDYNITNAHRLTFSYRYNMFDSTPDFLNSAEPRYPGFPNSAGQYSQRYMWQTTLRSTLGKSLVNEARVGANDAFGDGTYFGKGVDSTQFNCTGLGCQMSNGVGYNFVFPSVEGYTLTSATAYGGTSAGIAAQMSAEDTLTWLKGKHSMSFGGSYARTKMRNTATTPYPLSVGFGLSSQDTTAYNMLGDTINNQPNSAVYPGGISSTYAGYARNLYAFLTGRVTGISSTYYLQPDGSYIANGPRGNGTVGDDIGFFASDSWRVKPNLTLTLGVRYQVQLPMLGDGLYSRPQNWQMVYGITGADGGLYGSGNLYKPGVMTGTTPVVVKYNNSDPPYNTDWNNVAPSVGAAWRPALKDGFLSKILSKDPVFRGGYSITYTKLGTSFFDANYSGNPGRSRAGSRTTTSGTPVLPIANNTPVLLRDASGIYPSAAPTPLTGEWTITPQITEVLDIHYPDWPVPSTHQYSFGFQRELGKSTALDIRYVGNTEVGGWSTWTMTDTPQWSMLKGENGFYDEFRLAQANLRANIIAGKGTTFAYTGAAGTSPLPIFMAYLKGIPLADARNQDPNQYTSVSQFTSSSWYNSLNYYSPAITTIAGTGSSGLQNGITTGTGFDANRIAAGLPINFFIANPTVAQGAAYLETTAGNTRYNSMQFEVRRRMTAGFLIQGSYTYAFGRKTWSQRSLREDWFYVDGTGSPDHSVKANWVYELPFGRGKKFGSGVSALVDGFIGGWEFDGVARIQSGAKANYSGYRLVGMTEKEFAGMFKYYHVIDPNTKDANGNPMDRIYMLPQDVIQQSIIALYQTSATTTTGYANNVLPTGRYLAPASGPDCTSYNVGGAGTLCPGTYNPDTYNRRIVTGPMFWKVDFSFVKRIPIWKNIRVEARMDLYNVFNTINYASNFAMGSAITSWQVTAAASDNSNSQDPGGRITQFGLRVTW